MWTFARLLFALAALALSSQGAAAQLSEKDAQETRLIRSFKDLPSAAAAFDAALAKITA